MSGSGARPPHLKTLPKAISLPSYEAGVFNRCLKQRTCERALQFRDRLSEPLLRRASFRHCLSPWPSIRKYGVRLVDRGSYT